MHPETWTGRAIGSAVWWAVTSLLPDATFWAGLTATLLGVVAAFELERWRDRRTARALYARSLSAVRYESASLLARCTQALTAIQANGGLTLHSTLASGCSA